MNEKKDGTEIEITDAMIEAGAVALAEIGIVTDADAVALVAFKAMWAASKINQPKACQDS